MGQHLYSCLARLGCSWSPQKELPVRMQTMLGTAILTETPLAQLSSLIPATTDAKTDAVVCVAVMEHTCVAPTHSWVISAQSMNYAISIQNHDTCSHSNTTPSFASRAHPQFYGVWVLSQPLINSLVRVKAWPGSAASSHFRFSLPRARTQSLGQRGQLFAIFLLPLTLPPAAFNPFHLQWLLKPSNTTMNAKIHALQWQWPGSITLTESEGN